MRKIVIVLIGTVFMLSCSSKEQKVDVMDHQTVAMLEEDSEISDASFVRSKEVAYEYNVDNQMALERLTRELLKKLFLEDGVDIDYMVVGVHVEDDKEEKVLRLQYNVATIGDMTPSELAIAMVAKGMAKEENENEEGIKGTTALSLVCSSDNDMIRDYSFVIDKKDALTISTAVEHLSEYIKLYMNKVYKEGEKCEVSFLIVKDLNKEVIVLKNKGEYIEKEYAEYKEMFTQAKNKVLEKM